ncbi:MAG: CNNM domain-containing protein [Aeromonadaceae bacterium]
MLLLLGYGLFALFFSFICSLWEAVLLCTTPSYIQQLSQQHPIQAGRLQRLKLHLDRPLAAILTLNTLAHTVGAAGVGAQASVLFGSKAVGIASGAMTLLILIFTELLPKTIGTSYWRELAPGIGRPLEILIWLFTPFVSLSRLMASHIHTETRPTHIRDELAAMSQLGEIAGELDEQENQAIHNLLRFNQLKALDVMTPRTVIFSLPADMPLSDYVAHHAAAPFSRIPLYEEEKENIIGYVSKQELLLAHLQQDCSLPLRHCMKPLLVVLDSVRLPMLQQDLLLRREVISLVVNEYGEVEGLVTMEDLIETLLGLEIVEEGDVAVDMQKLARQLWQKRIQEHGIHLSED